jgi:hypothetical protein
LCGSEMLSIGVRAYCAFLPLQRPVFHPLGIMGAMTLEEANAETIPAG